MGAKTSQLQIRVSPDDKAALKRLADEAGVSVSSYVLAKALPSARRTFEERARAIVDDPSREATLGHLADFLRSLPDARFHEAVGGAAPKELPPVVLTYVAASVEREAARRGHEPPAWTGGVPPLERPHFAWDLPSLRLHLMRITPPAFKRRRAFVAAPADPRA